MDGPSIRVRLEVLINSGGTTGKIVRRFDAKELTDLGEVQVGCYDVFLTITGAAFA